MSFNRWPTWSVTLCIAGCTGCRRDSRQRLAPCLFRGFWQRSFLRRSRQTVGAGAKRHDVNAFPILQYVDHEAAIAADDSMAEGDSFDKGPIGGYGHRNNSRG